MLSKFAQSLFLQHNFRQFPKPFKTPLSEEITGRLWDVIYQALLTAFLMGMNHAGERVELSDELFKIMPEAIPFEEAARFLAARVALSKEEFYELEKQLRFRAFTVARLTELDAINRVKEKLVKVIEEGKTFQQFMTEGGEDELLKKAGFHRSNPWYWETVFRTNLQTAYNAGRKMQIEKDPAIEYLEFVGIRDSRQTEMCRRRSGVVRPASDPWWQRNWPPLHFNCYDEDTYVLTHKGWKLFKDLDGNELFVSLNPETFEIEYVPAIRKIVQYYEGEMIHFKSRNFDLLVTPDHNMAYISSWHYKRGNRKVCLRPAKEIADSDIIPRTGRWKGRNLKKIQIGTRKFPASLFMSFMGWYLAEGSITDKSRKKDESYWTIKIAQENETNKKEIYELCKKLFSGHFRIFKAKGGVLITGRDKEFYKYFKRLGYSYQKYIPYELKKLSPGLLRKLLDAFNKGDGSYYRLKEINAQKGGKWKANFKPLKMYFTSSKRLRDDIMELILKCGKLPVCYPKKGEGEKIKFSNGTYLIKHGSYIIAELNSKNSIVRKRTRSGGKQNILKVKYSGYVYCVELAKNHILYVMRNGKCTWSGNCRSSVRPIYREEVAGGRVRVTPKRKLAGLKEPMEGFGHDPVQKGTFWRITPGMLERAKKYGIYEEIVKLAEKLNIEQFCLEEFSMPKDIKELSERLTELKKEYPAVSSNPVVIEKDPLAAKELEAAGVSIASTGQIWLTPEHYRNIQRILEKGVIENYEELDSFHTLVHEFGHLLGEKVDGKFYLDDKGYCATVEVVNDLWSYFELRNIARQLGIKVKTPVRQVLTKSGYNIGKQRALKIFKTAGFTMKEVEELVKELNLYEDTLEFIRRIEKAIAQKLEREDVPPSIYREFGNVLVSENEEDFKFYLKEIKFMKKFLIKKN